MSSWLIGILLFSGSLYALAFEASNVIVWITPIGGTLFLIGWISLAYGSFKVNRYEKQLGKTHINSLTTISFSQLNDIMRVDQRRLSARIRGIGKIKSQEAQQAVVAEINSKLNKLDYV